MPTSTSTAEAPAPVRTEPGRRARRHPVPVPVRAEPGRRAWRRPVPATLAITTMWLATRAALVVFTVMACWLLRLDSSGRLTGPTRWFLERFTWWDSFHFLRIVDRGYLSVAQGGADQAFFPGYPLAIAAVRPLTGGNAALAGFVVSVVAGTVAAVVLARLGARATGTARGGWIAVTILAIAPYGFFLVTVYSEALFLACALGAWAAGLARRWWLAGVLAALASLVQINGLFLAAALAVMYLQQHRRGIRPDVIALALPALAVAAFLAYLRVRTGAWGAWQQAQDVWNGSVVAPWTGLQRGWDSIRTAGTADLIISRWADLVVTVGGIVLVVLLAVLRRWPETVFVLLTVAVLTCSTALVSAPRYALMWFPTYLLAAELGVRPRWRWLTPTLVVACVPLLGVVALSFASHGWTA